MAGRDVLAAQTLTRFSLLAGGVLVAVAATGTFLAWRIVGLWAALVESRYGWLLLAKVGIALARGRKLHDKRDKIKERSWDREKARLLREKG